MARVAAAAVVSSQRVGLGLATHALEHQSRVNPQQDAILSYAGERSTGSDAQERAGLRRRVLVCRCGNCVSANRVGIGSLVGDESVVCGRRDRGRRGGRVLRVCAVALEDFIDE